MAKIYNPQAEVVKRETAFKFSEKNGIISIELVDAETGEEYFKVAEIDENGIGLIGGCYTDCCKFETENYFGDDGYIKVKKWSSRWN